MMHVYLSGFIPFFLASSDSNLVENLIKPILEAPLVFFVVCALFVVPYSWCIKRLRHGVHPLDNIKSKKKLTDTEKLRLLEFYCLCFFVAFCSLCFTIIIVYQIYSIPIDDISQLHKLWFVIGLHYIGVTVLIMFLCGVLLPRLRHFRNHIKSAWNERKKQRVSPPSRKENRKLFRDIKSQKRKQDRPKKCP